MAEPGGAPFSAPHARPSTNAPSSALTHTTTRPAGDCLTASCRASDSCLTAPAYAPTHAPAATDAAAGSDMLLPPRQCQSARQLLLGLLLATPTACLLAATGLLTRRCPQDRRARE